MSDVLIRTALARDLEVMRAIFNHYVECSSATFRTVPETQAERRAWFEGRTEAHPALTAESAGEAIGWAALTPWKATGGYRHAVELSVYLREDARGKGVGKLLLAGLIERARAAGHHAMLGGVCTEQTASVRLHLSMGFTQVAHLREVGFKFGRWLDVAYFEKLLQSTLSA